MEVTIRQPREAAEASASACILAAGVLWGIVGVWTRNMAAGGLSPWSIVVIRNWGGLAVLTIYCLLRDRGVFHVAPRHLKYFFGTGVVSVLLYTLCYYSGQQISSLAVATILMYTSPAFVVLLAALVRKEPVTRKKVTALGLTFVGCALTCGLLSGGLTATPLGVALGLGSGFFYALYSIFAPAALAHYTPMAVTYWTYVFSAAGSLLILRPAELAAGLVQPRMWILCVGMVVVSSLLPYILYTKGLTRVEPGRASIMASVELVMAAVTGVLAFGEPMTAVTAGGIACVLAGVYILR